MYVYGCKRAALRFVWDRRYAPGGPRYLYRIASVA